MSDRLLYIGGEWIAGSASVEVTNPATGEVGYHEHIGPQRGIDCRVVRVCDEADKLLIFVHFHAHRCARIDEASWSRRQQKVLRDGRNAACGAMKFVYTSATTRAG